uniref:Uncharacterized protein n=1 Tax=Strombidium inclinatum TaxID=197538 RepID=A0A7S3MZL0_9SPIT|mmetsp:Transcript_32133/g.49138  ORF Transcript_32133/g.49138 Transcript_32133/m.49138 type:complete len:104 (+) Transcript_32133:1082-1393(+)
MSEDHPCNNYLENFENPLSDEEEVLLQEMLRFNPTLRKSAAELISSPVFDCVRDPLLEAPASAQIFLEIDEPDKYDYEKNIDSVSIERYTTLMEDLFKAAKLF